MVSLTCGCHVSSDGRVTQQCMAHSMETQTLGSHADEVARLALLLTASEERVRVLSEALLAARKSMPADPDLNEPWSHAIAILDEALEPTKGSE